MTSHDLKVAFLTSWDRSVAGPVAGPVGQEPLGFSVTVSGL